MKLLKQSLSLMLSLLVLFTGSWTPLPRSFAADDSIVFVQVQMLVTNDADGNNYANIGDQLTIFVVLNNADGGCVAQNTQVFADISAYGGPTNQALNCGADNGGTGDQFGVQFIIQDGGASAIDVAANNAASAVTVTATDSDENNGAGNPNPIQNTNPLGDGVVDTVATNGADTDAPVVTDAGVAAVFATDNGVGGVAGVGDIIELTYTPLTDGITDPNPNTIFGDLSQIGGSNSQLLFDDGTNGDDTNADGTFTYELTIAEGGIAGIDATGLAVGVTLQDDAGNSSGATVNDSNTFTVDASSPIVTDVNVSAAIQVDNNTDGTANTNDVVRVIWDNSGTGDNNVDTLNSVTTDISAFGGVTNQQLFDDGTNGDQVNGDGIYTYDFTVGSGAITSNNLNASVTVTDDAGNATQTSDSSNLTVNNTTTGVSSGGRRRSSTQEEFIAEQEESEELDLFGQRFDDGSSSQEWEDLQVNAFSSGCGCSGEKQALDQSAADLFGSYLTNPGGLMCVAPSCLDISPHYTQEEENSLKKELYDAMRRVEEASKTYDNAIKNVIQKDEAFDESLKNDPFGQVTAASEQAYEDYKAAVRAKHQADNELIQAQQAVQETREKAHENLGTAGTAELVRQYYQQPDEDSAVTPLLGCFVPGCGEEQAALRHQFLQDREVYRSCLLQCVDENLSFSDPFEGTLSTEDAELLGPEGLQFLTEDLSETSVKGLGDHYEGARNINAEAFEPFTSLSGAEELPRAYEYAEDVFNHHAEPFIVDLYEAGVVNGVNNGFFFEPNAPLDRAAMLKIALKTFGKTMSSSVRRAPFADVAPEQWFAPYFDAASRQDIIRGYGPEEVPRTEREARPGQNVNRVEALAILARTGGIDTSSGQGYESEVTRTMEGEWWSDLWNWAEMNGVVHPDPVEIQEEDDQGQIQVIVVQKGDRPEDEIKRWEMSEMAIKLHALRYTEPCNCDKEKAAWEQAEKDAAAAEQAANDAEEAAQKEEAEGDAAEEARRAALDKVRDLNAFFDDSSYIEDENGRITRGDLLLLEEVNAGVFASWQAGDITAEEASEEWEGNNRDKLEELRAQKAEELEQAQQELEEASAKADKEKSEAETARAKADQAKKDAENAKLKAEQLEKAYEECVEKCNELKKKVAVERKRQEEARRKRALEEARRRAEEERKRRQAEANTPPPTTSTAGEADGGEGGPVPVASKDPCKEKFLQAVAARGKQIAEARPEEAKNFDPNVKTALDVSTGIGELIAAAAQAAATGGQTTLQIASGLAALPQVVYGFWVDYVGSAALSAGKSLISGRICQAYQAEKTGKCGYEVLDGQVVYWQRDAQGNMSVVIMGPGDDIERQQCSA